MEVAVYADLLFLINAGMDGLCLSMTARLLHRRPRVWRLLLGAAAGGLYAVLALFLDTGAILALVVDILVCLLMCAVVYGGREGRGVRGWLGAAAVYTALSMVMGGVLTALFNLWNRAGFSELLPAGGEGIGAWLFLVFSVAGSIISMRGGRLCRRSGSVRLCEVTIEVDSASGTIHGLADSGNLLRDPAGGHPVICVGAASVEGLLSPELAAVMASGGMEIAGLTSSSDIRRLRLIPAETATGGGLLPGFRPDRIILKPEGGKPRTVDAVIAITPDPPRGTEAFGAVEALVPTELL